PFFPIAEVWPLIESLPITVEPLLTVVTTQPVSPAASAVGLIGSNAKPFVTVTESVSPASVAAVTVEGSEALPLPSPTNAGLGTVSPFSGVHAGQSAASVCVIVTLLTLTRNAVLPAFAVTPEGRKVLTASVEFWLGTFHVMSHFGAADGTSQATMSTSAASASGRRIIDEPVSVKGDGGPVGPSPTSWYGAAGERVNSVCESPCNISAV